jgi:DNA helicase-2/ATP-dependent DNA helicase PcrA
VVRGFDDDGAEAAAVATWLRLAHPPGRRWSQLAVLARTNARLRPVADALGRAGIPYRLASTRLPAATRSGARGQTAHTPHPAPIPSALTELRRQHRGRPLRSALAELVVSAEEAANTNEDQGDVGDDGHDAVLELVRLADEHALDTPDATVSDFLAWLATQTGPDVGTEARDSVTLSTFHRAKGLQWRAVAVVGLEDGMVPIAYARTPEATAEERRLLYVGVTRAEDELWCSWAAERHVDERSWCCEPSPFIAALAEPAGLARLVDGCSEGPRCDDASPSTAVVSTTEKIARLRARLADTA